MVVNHNNLPDAITILLQKASNIESRMSDLCNPMSVEQATGKMNTEGLISFMVAQGLRMSKSKLYKLVSAGKIPHMKFNGCLVFSQTEIEQWIDSKMDSPAKSRSESLSAISRSAQNHERRSRDGK